VAAVLFCRQTLILPDLLLAELLHTLETHFQSYLVLLELFPNRVLL
jgi:hypothetical protein